MSSFLLEFQRTDRSVKPQDPEVLQGTKLPQKMFALDFRVYQQTIVLALVDSFIEPALVNRNSLMMRPESLLFNWKARRDLQLS